MKRTVRLLSLLLILTLALGGWTAARADVVSVGVYLTGMIPAEDGTQTAVKLEGRFRIYQDGVEIGTVKAGGETLTLDSTDRIRIEPMPETIRAGWDLSTAYQNPVLEGGGTVLIPVIVYPLKEAVAETEPPVPTETPAPEGGELVQDLPDPAEPEEGNAEPDQAEDEPEEMTENLPAWTAGPTPTLAPYNTPAPATPEPPQLPPLAPADNTGSIRIQVFQDKNENGVLGLSEPGVEQITVALLDEAGEAITTAVTDSRGQILFENVPAGNYRTRVYLPSGWMFTKFGGENSLEANAFQLITEGDQTSGELAVRAGEETLQGVGIRTALHVSGTCWLEETVDGHYKSGEPMLPGVRITLEGQKNGLFYETYSAEDGSWYIDRVRPGFYTLTAYVPDGMMFTRNPGTAGKNSIFTREGVKKASKTLDLNDKVSKENQYIGFAWSAQVYGRCYLDANYNGLYDEGELPLPGVKVTAIKQLTDDEIAVTWSDENGNFVLSGLRGNTYKIRAVLPADGADFTVVNTQDPLGNRYKARPDRRENFWNDFKLADMEKREIAIGAIYPATIKGTVYLDNDFSATLSGNEKIVSGFLVVLKDKNGETAAMDRSNIKGVYELTGVAPGDYTLSVTAIKGYAFTKTGEGNVILNKTAGEGYSEQFHVDLGELITGKDIGMIRPGTIRGSVFADRNDNGVRDGGENGLTGTVVRLVDEDGGEAFRAEIGEDGAFLFDAVMPGRYCVEYDLPESAVFARTAAGGNTLAAEGNTGRTELFDFAMGDVRDIPLVGALTLGSISGSAFGDHDGDGVRSADGEEALAGLTVSLVPSREGLETVSAVTGEDGSFLISGLRPDSYTLQVTCPDEYVLSRTDQLALPLVAGRYAQDVALDIPMGATWNDQQIGAVIPAAIRGRLWLDENCNGLFDDGEKTPAGYPVTIIDESTGRVFDTPVTDEDGCFAAAGMIPGTFAVSMQLDDYTLAPPAGDSTFREEEGQLVMRGIALREDETREGLLLGVIRHTAISGTAWIDRGDLVETLAGMQVHLTDGDGNILQTIVTGGNGEYRFEHLLPGEYALEAEAPEGSVIIEPADGRLNETRKSVMTTVQNRLGKMDSRSLQMDQDWEQMDIGCVLPGRLGDFCWLDLNGDGLQGAGEAGIPNVRIELQRNGETVAETVTDQYGFYRFTDLYPAAYTLRVTPPAEVKPTVPRTDLRIIASVLTETEDEVCTSGLVTVESNKDNFNADLGFVCRREGVIPAGVGEGKKQIWR